MILNTSAGHKCLRHGCRVQTFCSLSSRTAHFFLAYVPTTCVVLSIMSLINQTCWVVGGVGVIGRGIARGLLKAGATVIVNSSDESRLEQIAADLMHPSKLILVQGDLLPGSAESTFQKALSHANSLNHVVAHGAVRYWTQKKTACDETYSLNTKRLLDMDPDEFLLASSQLVNMHFNAAKTLLPMMEGVSGSSYTFVTGDGGGHLSGKRSATGEINSHHIWGLSAALRGELQSSNVTCREVRVRLPINRSVTERANEPRDRPLSGDIGDLCAGIASSGGLMYKGELIEIDSQATLEDNLIKFKADEDKNINLPHVWEFNGSL